MPMPLPTEAPKAPATPATPAEPGDPIDLARSVAGEEDPGASLDLAVPHPKDGPAPGEPPRHTPADGRPDGGKA